jgi:Rod binding domain-containing protein
MKVTLSAPAPTPADLAPKAHAPAEVRAAREFEQIFLRKMLSSLEKTGRMGKSSAMSGGSDMYSSMVVSALADAIANAGGIGLSSVVLDATAAHTPAKPVGPPTQNPVIPSGSGALPHELKDRRR